MAQNLSTCKIIVYPEQIRKRIEEVGQAQTRNEMRELVDQAFYGALSSDKKEIENVNLSGEGTVPPPGKKKKK